MKLAISFAYHDLRMKPAFDHDEGARRGHTDQVAQLAARMFHEGKAGSVAEAIRLAVQKLGVKGDPPSQGLVRKHLQAMSMQAMGSASYARAMQNRLREAEQMMSALDEHYAGVPMFLVGRAAKGHVDGDTTLHIRIYTDEPIEKLASLLVDIGYSEPAFETADSRMGRLNRLRFAGENAEIMLTRCLPAMLKSAYQDLFTNEPIASLSLKQLRARLEE